MSVPVPHGLEKGDVLLFSPQAPSWMQSNIVRAQEMVGAPRVHACFTHVALYLGAGMIHEATPALGVWSRHISTLGPGSYIRARRFPGITHQEQDQVCTAAAQLGGSYAAVQALVDTLLQGALPHRYASAIQMLIRATMHGVSPRQAFYCSSLVDFAYVKALQVRTYDDPGIVAAMPWTLSATKSFVEVPIHW